MRCADCKVELNALNMSDVDEAYCGDCADKRIAELQKNLEKTTLVLWENN